MRIGFFQQEVQIFRKPVYRMDETQTRPAVKHRLRKQAGAGQTDNEKRARIVDLLKARSGIYIPSASQSEAARAALPERGSQNRDANFYYNNWDFNALGTIFEQETGKGIFAEFAARIAAPLEMEHFVEEDGLYYFEREYSTHPAYHFNITANDLARFGLLYLRNGRWKDQQVVPANWITASTTTYSVASEDTGYGYLWWTITDGSYAALGYGGHWVHVIPDEKLVIVHRTDTDNEQTVSTPDYIALQTMIRDARNKAVPVPTTPIVY